MAKKFETAIVISGDGQGGVRAIKANREELDKYSKSVETSGTRTRSFARDVDSSSRELDILKGSAKTAGAAIIGAFAVGNLRGQAKMIADTQSLAQTLEVSTGTLQAWQYAGQQAGLEADKVGDIFKDVSDKIGDFAATGGGEAADLFNNLNLNVKELQRLSPDQQILKIAEAVNQLEDPSQRTFYFESLADEMSRLGPLLANGAAGLRQQMQAARELGVAMDDVDVQNAVAANRAMIQLGGSIEGVTNQLISDLGPGLADAASNMAAFVRDAGGADEILDDIAHAATLLAALYAGKFAKGIGEATVKTLANIKANVAQAQATANANAAEAGRVAALARSAAAEKTAEANSAALASRRAASARQDAASEVERVRALQASLAAERALEAQRLQSQISAKGRQQSLARLAELRRTEAAMVNQLTAANTRLTEAELAEASAARAATAAKIAQGRANTAATTAVTQYTAATRVATVASGAMATAGRAASAALGLLGGPVGVAFLAAGALYTFREELGFVESKSSDAKKEINLLTGNIRELTQAQLENAKVPILSNLTEAKSQAAALSKEVDRLKAKTQSENIQFAGRPGAGRAQLSKAEAQLAKLKDQIEQGENALADLNSQSTDWSDGVVVENRNLKGLITTYDKQHAELVQLRQDREAISAAIKEDPEHAEQYRRMLGNIDDQIKKLTTTQKASRTEAQKAAEQLKSRYESTAQSLAQQIDLMGQTTNAARINYETESGALKDLKPELKEQLRDRAKELDLLQRRQDLLDNYVKSSSLSDLFDARDQAQQIGGAEGRIATRNVGQAISEQARQGAPQVQGLDAQYSGAFGEANRIEKERAELQAWYAERIAMYEDFKSAEADKAAEYGAVIEDLERQRATQLQQIDAQTQQARLAGYSDLFGNIADVTKTFAGEQSGLYKTMFAASKAFAIANSIVKIQSAIADASAAGPFPANLAAMATVAAQTASIVSTISSTGLTGQAHEGIDNTRAGTWLLEDNERVVDKRTNADLKQYLNRANAANQSHYYGGKGGDVTVKMSVTVQAQPGMSDADARRQGKAIGDQAEAQMRQFIIKEKRPGGLLAS
ncbi:hypothetical protein F0A16_20680 [Salinicola corii]|uniref:Bacteriophage tail tape measure N-terminal domain-containing protein n=1 Tax=Salinicola corii TaxID=2606937 RepID=A0A640W797_9GAMM|nr:hypothetical protein [Salinicola corii]KAA0015505.1 hypothetical protein F0A16_20680 [Salinicola corii]